MRQIIHMLQAARIISGTIKWIAIEMSNLFVFVFPPKIISMKIFLLPRYRGALENELYKRKKVDILKRTNAY